MSTPHSAPSFPPFPARRLAFAAALAAAALLAAPPAPALVVDQYDPVVNNRFTPAGMYTNLIQDPNFVPVPNTSPLFAGYGYDFSGVGWIAPGSGYSMTMLTPLFQLGVSHIPYSTGSTNMFFARDGQLVRTFVRAQVSDSARLSDASLIRIASPVPSTRVAIYPVLDPGTNYPPTWATNPYRENPAPEWWPNGQDAWNEIFPPQGRGGGRILMYGANARVGTNFGVYYSSSTNSSVWLYNQAVTNAPGMSTVHTGDSGSPSLAPYTDPVTGAPRLALLGAHSFLVSGEAQGMYLPSIATNLNAIMNPYGYALRWASPVHQTWGSGGADGRFTNAANWSSAVPGSMSAVLLDAAAAGGQTVIDLGGAQALLALYVKNQGGVGFTLTNGSLLVGRDGIVNGSNGTLVMHNDVALATPQYWDGGHRGIVVNGALDNQGHLLEIDGSGTNFLNGGMTGAGGLAKDGAGHLVVGGTAGWQGATFVHEGTILVSNATAAVLGGPVKLDEGAGITFAGARVTVPWLEGSNASVRVRGGGLSLLLPSTNITPTLNLDATAPVSIGGSGTLKLGGSNVFMGGLTVTGPTLSVYGRVVVSGGGFTNTTALNAGGGPATNALVLTDGTRGFIQGAEYSSPMGYLEISGGAKVLSAQRFRLGVNAAADFVDVVVKGQGTQLLMTNGQSVGLNKIVVGGFGSARLTVSDGALVTNVNGVSVGVANASSYAVGSMTGWLFMANGGVFTNGPASSGPTIMFGGYNMAGGPGVGLGLLTDPGTILVAAGNGSIGLHGSNATYRSSVVVSNGAFMGTAGAGGISVGAGSLLVTEGGILHTEFGGLSTVVNGSAGAIAGFSNLGGVFQFGGWNPAINTNGGAIVVQNGTISFRGIGNASVTANISGNGLTNLAYLGTNSFMLNNASNTSVASYTFSASYGATNWAGLTLTGPTSAWRSTAVRFDTDASLLVTNTVATVLGTVTNDGTIRVSGSSARFQNVLVNQGVVGIDPGSVFEANALTNRGSGAVSNVGGIYQFSTATPTVAVLANQVLLANGTIAMRGIANADVRANQTGALTNLTFQGVNFFRLNNASNFAASEQSYTFNAGLGPTNYAGLEMVNGGTAWRSAWLGIGPNGTLLISNTTADLYGTLTNAGVITVANALATYWSNVVVNGGTFVLRGGTNRFNGGLAIAAASTLSFTTGTSRLEGAFTNAGTVSVMNGSAVFGGNVVNLATWVSDPSTNAFNGNFTVGPTATVVAAAGDVYAFGSNFVMQSTNRAFDMSVARLVFTDNGYGITTGNTNHVLDLSGSGALDKGSNWLNVAELATNFSFGALTLAPGNRLTVTGQKLVSLTNAAYVGWLDLQGVVTNSFTELTNSLVGAIYLPDINLYYEKNLAANAWLQGLEYGLWGDGGRLIPIPEPPAAALAALGLGLALLLRFPRRRDVRSPRPPPSPRSPCRL